MIETEALLFDLLLHRALLPEFTRDASHAERAELLLGKPLGILNDALGNGHLAGADFTVADLNVASILAWGRMARLKICRRIRACANGSTAAWRGRPTKRVRERANKS